MRPLLGRVALLLPGSLARCCNARLSPSYRILYCRQVLHGACTGAPPPHCQGVRRANGRPQKLKHPAVHHPGGPGAWRMWADVTGLMVGQRGQCEQIMHGKMDGSGHGQRTPETNGAIRPLARWLPARQLLWGMVKPHRRLAGAATGAGAGCVPWQCACNSAHALRNQYI